MVPFKISTYNVIKKRESTVSKHCQCKVFNTSLSCVSTLLEKVETYCVVVVVLRLRYYLEKCNLMFARSSSKENLYIYYGKYAKILNVTVLTDPWV